MSVGLGTLRTGIQTRLRTIAGLQVYDQWPGNVQVPGAVVMPRELEYRQQFQGDLTRYVFSVILAVSLAGKLENAQTNLDAYLNNSGATSVEAAIDGDRTLGGNAHSCWISLVAGYDVIEIGNAQYLGATLDLEVWAS